jgi:hypothetical protein
VRRRTRLRHARQLPLLALERPRSSAMRVAELRDAGCLEVEGSLVWCVWQLAEDSLMSDGNPTHRTRIRRDVVSQFPHDRFRPTA